LVTAVKFSEIEVVLWAKISVSAERQGLRYLHIEHRSWRDPS
jgi:hypothetical protein